MMDEEGALRVIGRELGCRVKRYSVFDELYKKKVFEKASFIRT